MSAQQNPNPELLHRIEQLETEVRSLRAIVSACSVNSCCTVFAIQLADFARKMDNLGAKIDIILTRESAKQPETVALPQPYHNDGYTVKEVAKLIGRSLWVVRQLCNKDKEKPDKEKNSRTQRSGPGDTGTRGNGGFPLRTSDPT